MEAKSVNTDLEAGSKEELNKILINFYVDVRKGDGHYYKKTSLAR